MNRALLVGIDKYASDPLPACVNDVTDMKAFLLTPSCGFQESDIHDPITDAEATASAITDGLRWLLAGVAAGDRILFHYSGHGAQNGTEDVICPVDYDAQSGANEIGATTFESLFAGVPEGVEFIWISDSCFSGDLLGDDSSQPAEATLKTLWRPPEVAARVRALRAGGPEPRTFLAAAAASPNVALVAACASDGKAHFYPFTDDRENGVLTHLLLCELQSPAGLAESLEQALPNVQAAAYRFDQVPQLAGAPAIRSRAFMALPS